MAPTNLERKGYKCQDRLKATNYHVVLWMTCSAGKGLENEVEVLTVLEDGY